MSTVRARQCAACPAMVYDLVYPKTGKPAPIDSDPVRTGGNVEVDVDAGTYSIPGPGPWRHLNHFVTCPRARQFRSQRPA